MFDFNQDGQAAIQSTQFLPPTSPHFFEVTRRHMRSDSTHKARQDENRDPSARKAEAYSVLTYGFPSRAHIRVEDKPSCSNAQPTKRNTRPPLVITIPEASPRIPKTHRRIFNTHTPPKTPPMKRTMSNVGGPRHAPGLQATPGWVEAARKRASDSREQRAKLVAARLLALNNPRPNRFRFPPSDIPRPYIKSSLSRLVSVEA